MGVVRPVPRQRAQGMRPSGPSTLPVPEQAGQRHLRWPFQHAPQEILPVPSQCSQWAMVPPRVVAAVAAETARPAVCRAPHYHTIIPGNGGKVTGGSGMDSGRRGWYPYTIRPTERGADDMKGRYAR